MSRRYQEILSELTNRASKKSRISGKQLLSLIREFSFYSSLPSDKQWVSSVTQIVKGTADSDTDYKILRTCLYLVVSSLLHDDWKNNEKERMSLLAEVINVVKTEMREMSGSKASFLCRTYGSLLASAPTKNSVALSTVAEALKNLKQSAGGEKQKYSESELQIWCGMLSALLRIVDGHTRLGTFFIPANCIDPIFVAASSTDSSVARHGSALLLQAALSPYGENNEESYGLAMKIISTFQPSERALNLIDPLSSSRILQTIAALSLRKGVEESLILELNLNAFKVLQHPSPKVYSDLVGCLLSSPRAKATVLLMQSSSDKEFKNKSVLARIVTECINRIRTATSSDKGSGTNPFLALPTLMRAAVHIGRFSCDCNVRCGDEDNLERLWQEVIGLHDNVGKSVNPLPHLVLGTLEALIWLTQSVTEANNDDIDDEGYQWLAVQDRVLRAIPLLRLSDSSVLAVTLTNCMMERTKQPEGISSSQRVGGKASEGDYSVRHHSKACLKLLLSAGEYLVHCYPNTESVMQLDKIWTFIAQFTVRPSGDVNTSDSEDKPLLISSAAPSDSSSPSYFLDLADLTGPASPSLAKKPINTRTPERTVHTFLRRSFLQALDSETAHAVYGDPVGYSRNKNKAQENAASLLMSQQALWHLAEHALLLPSASKEITSLIQRLVQCVNFGSLITVEIAASALVKLAVRFHRLLTECTATPVKGQKNATDDLMLLLAAPLGLSAVNSDDDTVTAAWSRSIMDYILEEIALLTGGRMGLAVVDRQSRSTAVPIATSLVAWSMLYGEGRGAEEEKGSAVDMSQLARRQSLSHDTSCWRHSDTGDMRNKEFSSSSVIKILWPVLVALSSPPSTPSNTADSGLSLMGGMSLTGNSSEEKHRRRERERDQETEWEKERERESRALMLLERPRAPVNVTTKRITNITPLTKYDKDAVPTPNITPTKSFYKEKDVLRDSSSANSNSIFGFNDSFSATTTAEPFSPSRSPASGPQLDFLTTPPVSRKSSLNKPETRDSFDAFKGHDFTRAIGKDKESSVVSTGQASTSILPLDWMQDTKVTSKDSQVSMDGFPVISHRDDFEGSRAPESPLISLFGPSIKSLALPSEAEGEVDGFRGPRSPIASLFTPTVAPAEVTNTARPIISRFSLKSSTVSAPVTQTQTQTQSQKAVEYEASFGNLVLVNPPLEIQVPFASSKSPGQGSVGSNPPFSPTVNPPFSPTVKSSFSPTVNIADDLVAAFQPSLSPSPSQSQSVSPKPPLTINADSRDLDFLFKDKAPSVNPSSKSSLYAPLSVPPAAGRGVSKTLKPPPISAARKGLKSPSSTTVLDIMNDKALSPFDVPSPFIPSTDLNAAKTVDVFAPSVSSFTASVPDPFAKPSPAPFTASVAAPFAPTFTPSTATTPAVFATTMPQYPYPYPVYGSDPRQYYPPSAYGAGAQYPNPNPYPYQGGGYGPPGAPYSVPPGAQWQQPQPPGPPVVPVTGVHSTVTPGGSGTDGSEVTALNPFDQFMRK